MAEINSMVRQGRCAICNGEAFPQISGVRHVRQFSDDMEVF